MRVLALTTPHVSSSFQLLAVRTLACAVLTTAVLTLLLTFDATYTPAAAACDVAEIKTLGTSLKDDTNMSGIDPSCGTTPAEKGDGCEAAAGTWNGALCFRKIDAKELVDTFFASGLGGVVTRIFSVVGILFALVMIGKSVMDAVQGGGGLSRAIGPIVAVLVLAALMMNIKGVAGLVARFITGFQSTLSAVLPFM